MSRSHSAWWLSVVALTALLSLPAASPGASVPELSPEFVLGSADTIFEGVVEAARPYHFDGKNGAILTEYSIRILRNLRDDRGRLAAHAKGPLVSLTFSGGRIGDVEDTLLGVPKLSVGEHDFFFINQHDWDALSPLVGMWQGLYRVQVVGGAGGREQVVRAGGCCTPPQPVNSRFFAKTNDAPDGFTADAFADEVSRALVIARLRPDLSPDVAPTVRAVLPAHVYDARNLRACPAATMPVNPLDASSATTSPRPPSPAMRSAPPPAPDREIVLDSQSQTTREDPAVGLRYGFFSGSPDLYITFNIAPNMGEFAANLSNMMGYWNLHADAFRLYDNPTNSFNFGNGRDEAGFATSAILNEQQGRGWGATEYAVTESRSIGGEIKEADVYFNLDPGHAWTTDLAAAADDSHTNPNNPVTYFAPVAIHELGHTFGLDHQWVTNLNARFPSVMNYYPANRLYDTGFVFGDDAAGITSQYGAPPRTNAILRLWYNDGTSGSNSNFTQWTIPASTSVQRGGSLAIGSGSGAGGRYYTIDNTGTSYSFPRVDFYLTPGFGSWDGAVYLGTTHLPSVGPHGSAQYQTSAVVPVSINPGQYYLAADMTTPGDEDANDDADWSYDPVTITAGSPPNDSYNTATLLGPNGGTYAGTTLGANYTLGGTCGASGSSPDVWYRITIPFDGTLEADTCGSAYDTVLEFFDSGLNSIACNDDATFGMCAGTTQSRLGQVVTEGSTFFIRVSGFNQLSGNFALRVRVVPANDYCRRSRFGTVNGVPTAVLQTGVPASGTTIGATPTPPGTIPPCYLDLNSGPLNLEGNNDVWYYWVPACSSPVWISTSGEYNFQLGLYDACYSPFVTPSLLDAGQILDPSGDPKIHFTPTGGTGYYIRVLSYDADAAFTVLASQDAVPNDSCEGALTENISSAAPTIVTVDTRCASPSAGGLAPLACGDATGGFDMGSDRYYTLNIQSTGTLQITRCNGTFRPVVALYSTCPDTQPQAALVCGFADVSTCDPIFVSYPVVAGRPLVMRVGGFPAGPIGVSTLTLSITPAPIGACCQPSGACAPVAAGDCAGVYSGDGSVCNPSPCPAPTGACCNGSSCTALSAAACAAASGTYKGEGIPCQGQPGNPITCCSSNFNGEGGVTVQDIFDFLAGYFGGSLDADVNHSGQLTVQDIFDFLTGYFAGCP